MIQATYLPLCPRAGLARPSGTLVTGRSSIPDGLQLAFSTFLFLSPGNSLFFLHDRAVVSAVRMTMTRLSQTHTLSFLSFVVETGAWQAVRSDLHFGNGSLSLPILLLDCDRDY